MAFNLMLVDTQNSNALNGKERVQSFAMIPEKPGFYAVSYGDGVAKSDSDAPDTSSDVHYWNVIQVQAVNTRVLQIASSPFRKRNIFYFRVKHDSRWYGWYALTGVEVTG